MNIVRSIVIDKITVNDSFSVRVCKHGLSEYLCCMQSRGSRQSDLDSIEILYNSTIFADIIFLITIQHFIIAKFFVECIAPMSFINNDQIIIRNGRHCIIVTVNYTFYKALHRSYMYFCFLIYFFFIKPFNVVYLIKGH